MNITYNRKSLWHQFRLARELHDYAMELIDKARAHLDKAEELSSRDAEAAMKWAAVAMVYREQAVAVNKVYLALLDPNCDGIVLRLERNAKP